jgi:glucose/arabinose dehydrogenase
MTELASAPGIDEPRILWIPSIGPSGLAFYTGDRFPQWKGNLFVGSVRRGEIPRTGGLERVVVTDKLDEVRRETLLTQLHQRIRDVRQGPDGLIYVLTDEDDGALLRIEPAT